MMPDIGPFQVTAEQIARLRHNFAGFINALLDREVAAAGQRGSALQVTINDSEKDGGVDARIVDADETEWLPGGESAWQFKRSDLEPTPVRKELRGAEWARELIAGGAKYRLVLGHPLTPQRVAARLEALRAEAQDLGLPAGDDVFDVIDANALARWATQYPSLAVAPVLGGPGTVARDLTTWSASIRLRQVWTPDAQREALMSTLAAALDTPSLTDLRVDGESGIGKTRLVLETLRAHRVAPLVAYIPDADSLTGTYVHHLLAQGRTAVVVVDECTGRQHEKLAEQIPQDAGVKLITIGPADESLIHTLNRITVLRMDSDDLESVLEQNESLWPEARRFVAAYAGGNIGYAFWIAGIVEREATLSASVVLTDATFQAILRRNLPEGDRFFGAAAIALFTRLGWSDELAAEAELVAEKLGVPIDTMREAADHLERHNLLSRQGRYCLVEPHPVASYLALEGWRRFSDVIVGELLPAIGPDLANRLFKRASDVGDFAPTRSAVSKLLEAGGPLGSLEAMGHDRRSQLLVEMAIVAPDDVADHVDRLLRAASPQELQSAEGIRRDLVRALLKLVWHSRLFARAADDLLLLALSENETWSNNATGVWTSLFGAALPATAAKPDLRAAYLTETAGSANPATRALVVKAAAQGLVPSEWVGVEGELQGGLVVERRGSPVTYGELFGYQSQMATLLGRLAVDADESVASNARDALLAALHPVLDRPPVRRSLVEAILGTGSDEMVQRLRVSLDHLAALFDRVGDPHDGRVEGIAEIRERLPSPSTEERLAVLAHSQRWDFEDGQLEAGLVTLGQENADAVTEMKRLLATEKGLPAAFELGKAIAACGDDLFGDEPGVEGLLELNFPSVTGYLWWQVEHRDRPSAFDDFIDGDVGQRLSADIRLALTVRGPVTEKGLDRVLGLLRQLSVAEGARGLFGWHTQLPEAFQSAALRDWLSRLATQADYNALIDLVNMFLYQKAVPPEPIRDLLLPLIEGRREFPDVAGEAWDWARLAERVLDDHAPEVLRVLLDGITAGSIHAFPGLDEDSALLMRCLSSRPADTWPLLADQILGGDWRIAMSLRGIIRDQVPIDVIRSWVGTDVDRARVAATTAAVSGEQPSEILAFLLDNFPNDEELRATLFGTYISGTWMGSQAAHLGGKIEQLRGWLTPGQSPNVAAWVRESIGYLERRREAAAQEEAERGW